MAYDVKGYSDLKLGQIVHFLAGFRGDGEFIRCVVVSREPLDGASSEDFALLPVAMVGGWSEHSLPRRRSDGEIDLGHYPKLIRDSFLLRPDPGMIWELEGFAKHPDDPRTLEERSLELPEMTKPEEEEAERVWAINEIIIQAKLSAKSPADKLSAIRAILEGLGARS